MCGRRVNVKKFLYNDGIKICYETKGAEGNPAVVFLHGNGENRHMFDGIANRLSAEGYRTVQVDTRGHGESDGVQKLHYADFAEDVYKIMLAEFGGTSKQNDERITVFGFSDGGVTALILGFTHPGYANKIVAAGANLNPAALKRIFKAQIKTAHIFTRSELLRLMLEEPDITPEQLGKITARVYLVGAENDIVRKEHFEHMRRCIPGAELTIIPGAKHEAYVEDNAKLYGILKPILTD
jgi:pimeloyl-ACP methyl ester carboxylesterase